MNFNRKVFSVHSVAYFLAFAISAMYSIFFVYYANGDLVNYYPFITPDGYDWYTEGMYFVSLMEHNDLPDLAVLRPPGFVIITSFDYIISSMGLVIAIVYFLAHFGTYHAVIQIVDQISEKTKRNTLFPLVALVLLTFHSVNHIKKYILSDTIAVALGLLSVLYLIRYVKSDRFHFGLVSGMSAIVAGLTQTYALLPYGVFCLWLMAVSMRKGTFNKNLLFMFIFSAVIFVLTTILWRNYMPHATTPLNFGLLSLSFGMVDFYINVWGIFLLPLIPIGFLLLFQTGRQKNNAILLAPTVGVCVTFAILCLIYQWPESRFTYLLWPWLVIIVCCMFQFDCTRLGSAVLTAVFVLSFTISPTNQWAPRFSGVSLNPTENWLIQYFLSQSTDRKLDLCPDVNCQENMVISTSDSYVRSSLKMYLLLKY